MKDYPGAGRVSKSVFEGRGNGVRDEGSRVTGDWRSHGRECATVVPFMQTALGTHQSDVVQVAFGNSGCTRT